MKTCSKCKIEKPFEDFQKRKSSKDGLSGMCKQCKNDYTSKYRNQEHAKEARLRYAKDNAVHIAKYQKGYREDNLDRLREAQKARNLARVDELREYHRAYNLTPAGVAKRQRASHKRRALEADTASDNWQASEVFESANWRCFYCGIDVVPPNRAEVGYQPNEAHADHFIPLSNGGTNEQKNIVCSCGRCNLSKNSKNPFDFIRDNINQQTED